ncbi:MAG: hypothetical protein ACLFR1_07235 [Spirochaetia bacterium]
MAEWTGIMETVADAFGMGLEEKARFQECRVAQLVAALPFLAKCEDPDRTAAAHLATYTLSVRTRNIFTTKETDAGDIYRRLETIKTFEGGDPQVIRRGMALLALNMLSDYKQGAEKDREQGKYNPVAEGLWDYEAEKRKLMKDIKSTQSSEIDTLLTAEQAIASDWNW